MIRLFKDWIWLSLFILVFNMIFNVPNTFSFSLLIAVAIDIQIWFIRFLGWIADKIGK